MTTATDLCNAALRRIRYPVPIGNMYEGSRAARVALDFYVQTRDSLFGLKDWPFLRRALSLGAAIKSAPTGGYGVTPWNGATNPPLPWQYEYQYPANCIAIRSVRPLPSVLPELAPVANIFVTGFDATSSQTVILTNLASAYAVITARVTDPDTWQDALFIETLIDALAVNFAKNLADDNTVSIAAFDARRMTAEADDRRG